MGHTLHIRENIAMSSSCHNFSSPGISPQGGGGVTTELKLLSQDMVEEVIDDEFDGFVCRVLVEKSTIKYVYVLATDCPGQDILIPPLPLGKWNVGRINKCPHTGKFLFTHTNFESLRGICTTWHPTKIDYLDLAKVGNVVDDGLVKKHLRLVAHPLFEKPVLMKIANVPELIGTIETETEAYRLIDGKSIGPKFLGHVTESGRVIGTLTEWIEGAIKMDPDNADACFEVLVQLHGLGISHGDVHPAKFLYKDYKVLIIDFEYAALRPTKEDLDGDVEHFDSSLK